MINKLSLMGLIGFLGLLFVPTGEISYCAFFAFFVFFGYLRVVPDELFVTYVRKAASTAFFIWVVFFCIIYTAAVLMGNIELFTIGFPLTFAAGMFTFICMLVIHEFVEQRGVENGA
ncbi:DUF3796 domain-containing protein [Methanorbis rubei]|uniref:DUF3796 domain-containing protein n=1 Tax=Methanorbis rubei TaxID=3028300 RepID=A0AAE4MGB7_9EURY|nr:hypothetical protein [Methanocorpusculaceae archaeon Cs1]